MQAHAVQPNNEPMLSVAEVALLRNCSVQYIQRLAKQGTLTCETVQGANGRPKYLIPLSALDAKEQRRYHGKESGSVVLQLPQAQSRPLDNYSAYEREQIHFWSKLIEEWQQYRADPAHKRKSEADGRFVAYAQVAYLAGYRRLYERPFTLTTDTLYRRWRAYKNKDYNGLIEKRGQSRKGLSVMADVVWEAFLSYYLDQKQYPISQCCEYTELWLREKQPELLADFPHYSSFYRRVQRDIPEPLEVLAREGEKAYQDRCAPYIRRVYDEMESNDYWIADTHTFDVMSANEEGKTRRLYLTAFFDARSGIFTGAVITEAPGSQAVLNALRKGIFKYGIPTFIYVDNGREFLTHDVGGLGHRKRKSQEGVFEPPAVFQRLGITMINALVRNARAKIIERRFLDIKNRFSRLFDTFTGGNVLEKPEQLKAMLKGGKAPTDVELMETAELLLDWYFNQQEYHGPVIRDQGKTRMQVYLENLHTKRVAAEEDLNLMLMRSSRAQKVTRRGIRHKVGDLRIDYWNEEFVSVMFGQEVYYRYDPDNLSSVRVYDLEDRYLMSVPADSEAICAYGCSQEKVKAAQKKIRQVEKAQRLALQNSGLAAYDRISALDLVLGEAERNRTAYRPPAAGANVIQLEQVNESPLLEKAVGYDIDTMIRNAEKFSKEGQRNE